MLFECERVAVAPLHHVVVILLFIVQSRDEVSTIMTGLFVGSASECF